jgi:hypothetical protein
MSIVEYKWSVKVNRNKTNKQQINHQNSPQEAVTECFRQQNVKMRTPPSSNENRNMYEKRAVLNHTKDGWILFSPLCVEI